MILVVGATGTNGREVVRLLAAKGEPVRALVRGTNKADGLGEGVEAVAGDLGDPASLVAALEGVDRAFFLPAVDRRIPEWSRNFIDAARRAGARHVVKFSGMGAGPDAASEIMRLHGESDRMLVESGLAYTILRPNSFQQNILWSAESIRDRGQFYHASGSARQGYIDVRDIAAVAVEALTVPGHEGQAYELTGPQSLSQAEVAATLSAVLGKPVEAVEIPLAAAEKGMLDAGMPPWNARAIAELYGVFATGAYDRTTDTVAEVTGEGPRTFEQFAREHAPAFR